MNPTNPYIESTVFLIVSHCMPMSIVMWAGGLLLIIVLYPIAGNTTGSKQKHATPHYYRIYLVLKIVQKVCSVFFSQSNTKGWTQARTLPDPHFSVDAPISGCHPIRAYSVYGRNLIAHNNYCKGHGCRHGNVVGSVSSKSAPDKMRSISSSSSRKNNDYSTQHEGLKDIHASFPPHNQDPVE